MTEYNELFKEYPDVVTIKDVQTMLGIGRNMVYNLLSSELIKAIRVGKKYIIPKRSVIDFLLSAS